MFRSKIRIGWLEEKVKRLEYLTNQHSISLEEYKRTIRYFITFSHPLPEGVTICHQCHGTGLVQGFSCVKCHGWGVTLNRRIDKVIPLHEFWTKEEK